MVQLLRRRVTEEKYLGTARPSNGVTVARPYEVGAPHWTVISNIVLPKYVS